MYYMEDWEKTKERFRAWWQQEIVDRIMIQAYAPRKKVSGEKHFSESWWCSFSAVKRWAESGFEMEPLLTEMEKRIKGMYFGGDAIPRFFVNLGPGSIAAYLGCRAIFRNDTVWFGPPVINDWSDLETLSFDPDNKLWRATKELTEYAGKRGEGRFLVTLFDILGATDLIPWLRGTEKFCIDLIEQPSKIKELRDLLVGIWIRCFDECYEIITKRQRGSLGSLPAWSPGKTYFLSCDISSLFSPSMYREFVSPEIQSIARHLDDTIYHLDGVDAVRHLDIILDVPEIKAIQFVPGVGGPGPLECVPMFRKIQDHGKSVFIHAGAREVEELISELSPKGLLISTDCDTEEEARDLVKKTYIWTARRT
jgi:hypothetical protein